MDTGEALELGGNIELVGFSKLDRSELVIVKKIVGSYARKFSDHTSDFENLQVTLKTVHEREKSEKFEIHVKLSAKGKPIASEDTDRNLFVVLDSVLKKVLEVVKKQ